MFDFIQYVFEVLVAVLVLVLAATYVYFKHSFTFWEKRNIPSIAPTFPFGNVEPVFRSKKSMSQNIADLYNSIKAPFFGIYVFCIPRLVVKDPELIKLILVKDFQYFQNRGNEFDSKSNALQSNLFSISGDSWQKLRNALSPAFTSGKLKAMMEIIIRCGKNLQEFLEEKSNSKEELEFKDLAARYTTDVISSVALGNEVNSVKNPNHEFREIGRKIFNLPTRWDVVMSIMFFMSPEILNKFKLANISREVYDFMMNVVRQTVTFREENNITRPDFMQLLIQLRNGGEITDDDDMKIKVQGEKQLSLDAIASEVNLFFLAGFETSSITMSSFFYEMAQNHDIMRKAQADIDASVAKHGGFNYEAMNDMKYLENCINETLRIYTTLPFLVRECSIDYKIPGHNAFIPKGTRVLIPLMGLHRDPDHFPNPMKFDPDRFSDERKGSIKPYTYFPFGEGKRACIGMRLGKMQVKMGLAMVLHKFDILKCSKTSEEFQHDPTTAGVVHLGGIWLKVAKRKV